MNNVSELVALSPSDPQCLALLCGPLNDNLQLIEQTLQVEIINKNNELYINGADDSVQQTVQLLQQLYQELLTNKNSKRDLKPQQVALALKEFNSARTPSPKDTTHTAPITIKTRKGLIKPRTPNQLSYLSNIFDHTVTFGIGPAGTGKTYLAVAAAVKALEQREVQRILLTRPAVEAGEKLGFLPGDLSQKVDPYLRPLYDALFDMLGFERVERLIAQNIIEIAPLAYMRGRTLNESFVILDESQNTTPEQMKMFLTRIGFNSRAVITGDVTQIDLPKQQKSGLKHAIEVLSSVDIISINYFDTQDVIRHPVVALIIDAYEMWENTQTSPLSSSKHHTLTPHYHVTPEQ